MEYIVHYGWWNEIVDYGKWSSEGREEKDCNHDDDP
jgi:hypothetical protein